MTDNMVYSSYMKQSIIYYYQQGYQAPTIFCLLLQKEQLSVSHVGIIIAKFLSKYEETGSIARTPGSGRPTKITAEVKALVEAKMQDDDETTAIQLHALLLSRGCQISKKTILCCHSALGWTFQGSAYFQLIRESNKIKHLE